MTVNLRHADINGEKYVNALDLLKLIADVIRMDSLHPTAIQALDGFGTGLAISLDMVDVRDLPMDLRDLIADE